MDKSNLKSFATFRVLMISAALMIIIKGMMLAQVILVPLMMATFIAIVCRGPISWLEKRKCPQWLALILVIFLLFVVGMLAALFIGTSIKDFMQNIPEYDTKLRLQIANLNTFLSGKGINIEANALKDLLQPEAIMKYIGMVLSEFSGVLANGFLILLMVVFISLEASGIPAKIRAVYGGDDSKVTQINKFNEDVKHYMSIKTMVSLVTGGLVTICLFAIGVDYPFLWGMLAFAFNFIPNIGSIIAAVPPVLLAIVQLGPGKALAVAICYLIINIVMGNMVEPRFMGKGLGLSPMIVFFSLLFWGWVFGPIGMLLSVVLTMKIKMLLESGEDTKHLALLLGPNPEK